LGAPAGLTLLAFKRISTFGTFFLQCMDLVSLMI
jgi:hypothetical protein